MSTPHPIHGLNRRHILDESPGVRPTFDGRLQATLDTWYIDSRGQKDWISTDIGEPYDAPTPETT